MKHTSILPTLLLLALLLLMAQACTASEPVIYVIEVDGMITAGTDMEIARGIEHASGMNAAAVLIEINTPGGLVDSMDRIVSEIERSEVPVITFVPEGARAFSAGAFILLSGHIAAMAPGTATGAATPIGITPIGRTSVENKTVNAYAARMRGIAENRNRSAEVAEKFVTEGLSLTAWEALEHGVIDVVAYDRRDLVSAVDNRTVNVSGESVTLHTLGAVIITQEPGFASSIVALLSNPQVAFVLFLIGLYGIIYGLKAPGTYVPEMVGAISLILALYGMGMFSVSTFGVLLIVAGIILLIAEVLTPTFGILTVGGAICLILGAIMFPQEPFMPSEWISNFIHTVFAIVILSVVVIVAGLGFVMKTRLTKPVTGVDELIGEVVKAETDIDPGGTVRIHGEIWQASAADPVLRGEDVVIMDVDGLTLVVEKRKR
ncbi:MAG: Membrane-bound protease [Candidatus Argoarchaeum ethanivorans]|uniref:Membrane-bound protease n=1 Tax=Candidatus Argoarchaeum ethanivorans TaxID=2608793 RepID=A0A811THA7_9EURY|nr:MAG: Membrane-bound protease [Candidatus Argoarchaeum ethanivorans]CAD6495143.1 MAG: Membrane-bound protease [Candidatus Argoarchaeum ethanivorans]